MLAVFPVHGFVKNYHWGKVGEESFIARFRSTENTKAISNNNNNDQSHDKVPLAELWFGAHPSGPSTVVVGSYNLKMDEFLAREPEMIGSIDRYYKYNKKLPFLFKILSIAQPLSLQAHPDKKLAQVLHKSDPKNYPDSNHKPELAIALTEFEVLCDFRPAKEIAHFLKSLTPVRRLIGEKNCDMFLAAVQQDNSDKKRAALSVCFKTLMTCDRNIIIKETKSLINDPPNMGKELVNLIRSLDKLYPGDPGVLSPIFLNYIKLLPGQAVYLKANKLHAYIKGECIECMACSDNVVRAGLTSKFRDVETLIGMLDYETVHDQKDLLLEGKKQRDPSIVSFAPTDEFKVDKITISHTDTSEFTLPAVSSGSFIAVFGGKASTKDFFDVKLTHDLALGSSGFVPPSIALKLYRIQSPMTIYRAYC